MVAVVRAGAVTRCEQLASRGARRDGSRESRPAVTRCHHVAGEIGPGEREQAARLAAAKAVGAGAAHARGGSGLGNAAGGFVAAEKDQLAAGGPAWGCGRK